LNLPKAIKQYLEVAPYLLIGLVCTSAFVFYPMIKGIYMSFFDYQVLRPQDSVFLGFGNYIKVIKDPLFYLALRNTALMVLVTVPGQWFFGIIVAMLVNLRFLKFKVLFRLIYYFPVITSWVVVSYLFQYLFSDGSDGIVNYLLAHVFHVISNPIGWLQNTWTANMAIWILSIWKGVGWVMIMYLAALMSIPRSLYEAAEMDGAKGVKMFIFITLPLMRPMTTFVLINLIIGAFTAFLQVYFLTNGGPLGSTEVANTYMFRHAFTYFQFGYASAVSVIIAVIVFMLTYSQQRKIGKERIEF
jgi:multiple sugar transport system permease protein